MTEDPRIYTSQELATVLRINIRYVRENAKKGVWPSLSFGSRTIRFTETHLQTILITSETAPPVDRPTRRRRRTP